ncbi:MerR family transcriptional regulator [Agromyces sp. SYSU T0242]|uniref:MerR family transcriptional regulator n=1 Tax=Agromyces litoreus TaxID=3158561 RepID=UPI003397BD44
MAIEQSAAEPAYRIGELAALTGMSVHTLRWYESRGLFPADIPRTSAGRRVYGEQAIGWLRLLARLRDSGMPVSEISKYADLVRAGDGNEHERVELMEAHARSLDEQIDRLLASREAIRTKIRAYRHLLAERGIDLPDAGGPGDVES